MRVGSRATCSRPSRRSRELTVPTLVVWATGDEFFDLRWAYWLRDTIPGVVNVVEIEGAKLFFPDERASDLVPHLQQFWATADRDSRVARDIAADVRRDRERGVLCGRAGRCRGRRARYLTRWKARAPTSHWWIAEGAGVALIVAGSAVLTFAFTSFVAEGIGTPAPVAPTEDLVVTGLYRHVRNPMYLAVVSIIAGQALLLGDARLVLYATVVGAAMAAFARWYEEPALRRRFGARYDAYRRVVPAWRPRVLPFHSEVVLARDRTELA